MVALPLSQASAIGVVPYRFAGCGAAPARSSRSTSVASLFLTAQCSAVVPSADRWFGSAPPEQRDRPCLFGGLGRLHEPQVLRRGVRGERRENTDDQQHVTHRSTSPRSSNYQLPN